MNPSFLKEMCMELFQLEIISFYCVVVKEDRIRYTYIVYYVEFAFMYNLVYNT